MSSTDSSQVIEDLKAARRELVSRGRCTGHVMNPWGAVCLVGAAIAATAPEKLNTSTMAHDVGEIPRAFAVVKALHRFIPERYTGEDSDFDALEYQLADYNDRNRGRVGDDDVLTLADKALADLGGLA